MSTDFFIKNKFLRLFCYILPVFFVVCSLVYAVVIKKADVEQASKNFYFLVSDSTHIEVSAHVALLNGGAGYVLKNDGREYVAYAVYRKETDVERAQTCMANVGEDTQILPLTSGDLYFKTNEEKRKKESVLSAFFCLYDCISLLEQEIGRLEKGATQQSSKRILGVLKKQFAYLHKEYAELFPEYGAVCESAKTVLQKSIESVVYVTDLRYLACELCFSYIELSKTYSI